MVKKAKGGYLARIHFFPINIEIIYRKVNQKLVNLDTLKPCDGKREMKKEMTLNTIKVTKANK